jgi:hypothetical protein
VAAAVDPAFTALRRSEAVVAVVGADAALADRVARTLDDAFTVVRGPFTGAAATVVAGASLPADAVMLATPAFAIVPDDDARAGLLAVDAPAQAPGNTRVPITALLRVRGGGGDVTVTLEQDGAVLDRATVAAPAGVQHVRVPLTFVPTQAGTAALRVHVQQPGGRTDAQDLTIDVVDRRWAVLFHDGRPTWMSTFVRRTLEQDPRFVVAGRVVTSRGIATEFGRPPARLDQPSSLAPYDAIVIGAPETLGAGDVAALEQYMRRRGGAVLLLLDRAAGGPFERLAGTTAWGGTAAGAARALAPPHADVALRAADMTWPERLPAGAHALLHEPDGNAVVWRSAVGAGRLVVSGALDAWRFRDAETSAFDEFWPALIAGLAHAAPPPVSATGAGVVRPGEWTRVAVTLRDAALADLAAGQPLRATVDIAIAGDTARTLHLWPAGPAGELTAAFRAPRQPGAYRIVITAGDARAELPLVVDTDAAHAAPDERDLLAAWTRARGGAALPAARMRELEGLLRQTLRTERSPQPWHPMRSPWWLLPFVAALAGEWWWRRRHGLR